MNANIRRSTNNELTHFKYINLLKLHPQHYKFLPSDAVCLQLRLRRNAPYPTKNRGSIHHASRIGSRIPSVPARRVRPPVMMNAGAAGAAGRTALFNLRDGSRSGHRLATERDRHSMGHNSAPVLSGPTTGGRGRPRCQ